MCVRAYMHESACVQVLRVFVSACREDAEEEEDEEDAEEDEEDYDAEKDDVQEEEEGLTDKQNNRRTGGRAGRL